uniref:Uncharacterized protein n=1 Tax=Octopus bimaculoides TaxID=37653 RepID=A0A0L8GYR5_OCTBM
MVSVLDRPELTKEGTRPQDGVRDMIIISNIDENGVNINLQTRYNKDLVYVSFHDPSDHRQYFGLHSSDRELLLHDSSNTFIHSSLSPSVDQISRTCFTFLSATKQNRVYI